MDFVNYQGRYTFAIYLLLPSKSMKVKVTQSCLTLCDPTEYTVQGVLQIRILESVAFSPSPVDLPTPGIEPGSQFNLMHCRILYQLSYQGSPLEKEMAIHSSTLAWKIP